MKRKAYRMVDPVIAAVLTLLFTFFIFAVDHRFPFQRLKTYIWSDEFAQYICVIKLFYRNLFSGESLQYTFTQGLGTEIFPEYINICFSPFNIFFAFMEDYNAAAFFAAAFKYAAAAASFALLTEYLSGEREMQGIFFGTAYALCGFALGGYMNIMFLDILYITPLITLSLIRLYRSGKWIFTALVYGYAFITNFYMAYIAGVFSSVFYISLILTGLYKADDERKRKLGILFWKWLTAGVVSVFLSACTLLPAAEYFLRGGEKDTNPPGFINIELTAFFKAFIKGGYNGINSDVPMVYCGIAAVIFAFIFLADKRRKKQDKVVALIQIVFLLLCTFVPLFNRMIHGGSFPHSFAFRFSFVYSFLFCFMAAMEWGHLRREGKYFSALVRIFAAACICGECVLGGAAIIRDMSDDEYPATYETWSAYNERGKTAKKAIENAAAEDSILFFRVRAARSVTEDQGSYFGWNSMESFNSFGNKKLGDTLVKMGVAKSYASIVDLGNNPLTDMIFSEHYILQDHLDDTDREGDRIEKNEYVLPPAFMVGDGIEEFSFPDDENVFDNLNALSEVFCGERVFLSATEAFGDAVPLTPVSYPETTGFYADEKYVYIDIPDDMEDEEGYAGFIIPESEKGRAYVYITLSDHAMNGSYAAPNSPWLYSGEEKSSNFDSKKMISRPFIDEIRKSENGDQAFYVVFDDRCIKNIVCMLPLVYFEDKDAVERMYKRLEKESLILDNCGEGDLKGRISTKEDGNLFVSIPYSPYWKLEDNGEKKKVIPVIDESFMAARLDAGEHELELVYDNPFIKAGCLVSLFSLAVLAFYYHKGKGQKLR